MKKLLSILLAACLIITSGALVFAAEEETSFVIENLKTTVVDCYDNGLTNAYKPEPTYISKNASEDSIPDGIILRAGGEWAKWSIEGITGGKYDISLEMESGYDTIGQVIVYVDDYMALVYQHTDLECKNDAKNQYRTHLLGSIEIPDGAKTIKIKNDSQNTSAVHVGKITLTKNDAAEMLPFSFATPLINTPDYYEKVDDAFQSSALPVAGDDYYIANGALYTANYSTSLTKTDPPYTILRVGDWSRYDVEGLKPGNYKISMNIGTRNTIGATVLLDGKEKLAATVDTTGGLTTYATKELGNLYIGKNTKYLTIRLDSDAIYARQIILEYISDDVNMNIKAKDADDFYNLDSESLELSSDSVVLTNTEWVSYALNELPDGLYDVKVNTKSSKAYGVFYSIYLGDDLVTKIKPENTSEFSEISVGTIEIKGDSILKIVSEGRYASYINSITITNAIEGNEVNHDLRIYGDNSTATYSGGTVSIVNGTDYYDVNNLDYSNYNVYDYTTSGARIQHANDWTRYNVKGMKSGTYNLTQNVGAKSSTSVTTLYAGNAEGMANGNVLNISKITEYEDYTTSKPNSMGTVYIPEGTEYLWAKTTGNSAYIYSFDFDFVSEEDLAAALCDLELTQHYTAQNKNKITNETLSSATVVSDYSTGDFYDTANSNVHILWTIDSVDEVLLRETEWVKYKFEAPKGLYDLTVNYSVYNNTVGAINIKFLDKNQNVIATETVKTVLEASGSQKTIATKIEDVILPQNALYVVAEGAEGTPSFNSLKLTPSIGGEIEYTSDEAGENKIENINGASSVYAQVRLANGKGKENVTVIIARYNGGQFVDAEPLTDISVARNEFTTKTYKVDLEAGYSVRTFVWSDITDGLIPLCASGNINQ